MSIALHGKLIAALLFIPCCRPILGDSPDVQQTTNTSMSSIKNGNVNVLL